MFKLIYLPTAEFVQETDYNNHLLRKDIVRNKPHKIEAVLEHFSIIFQEQWKSSPILIKVEKPKNNAYQRNLVPLHLLEIVEVEDV